MSSPRPPRNNENPQSGASSDKAESNVKTSSNLFSRVDISKTDFSNDNAVAAILYNQSKETQTSDVTAPKYRPSGCST